MLFISDDTITQYLAGEEAPDAYHVFEQEVETLRTQGGLPLTPGSVTEPCHIYCARTPEWKLVKYWDPHNRAPNEWELYYLVEDNYELYNLVSWASGEPIPEPGRIPTSWSLTSDQLNQALVSMRELLVELEKTYLGGPRPVMEPYTFDG